MEHKRFGDTCYIRLDRGDEVISSILAACRAEHVESATFSGIGGCSEAKIQTFIPEEGAFEERKLQGMLELVSLIGNVVSDDEGKLHYHAHAAFAYKEGEEHHVAAGHVKSITISYTAEIELRPIIGGTIKMKPDPETGTGFWSFSD